MTNKYGELLRRPFASGYRAVPTRPANSRAGSAAGFSEERRDRDVATDNHAPEDYRADTVRNLDAWYDAFDVRPGQRLHLGPSARVRVW